MLGAVYLHGVPYWWECPTFDLEKKLGYNMTLNSDGVVETLCMHQLFNVEGCPNHCSADGGGDNTSSVRIAEVGSGG